MREELANMRRTVERMAAAATPGAWGAAAAAPPPNDDQRPMTFDEKRTLSMNINKLPSGKLNKVLQIIAESMPLGDQNDEEIEIDIGALDTKTLRELQRYVKGCLTKKKPRPKKNQPQHQLQAARSQQAEVARRMQQLKNELHDCESGGFGSGLGADDSDALSGMTGADPTAGLDMDMGGIGVGGTGAGVGSGGAVEIGVGATLDQDSSDSSSGE